jgi:hypothetical protein
LAEARGRMRWSCPTQARCFPHGRRIPVLLQWISDNLRDPERSLSAETADNHPRKPAPLDVAGHLGSGWVIAHDRLPLRLRDGVFADQKLWGSVTLCCVSSSIGAFAHQSPPPPDGCHCKFGCVARLPDVNTGFVARHIVNTIRNGLSYRVLWEIMHQRTLRRSLGLPFAPVILKVAHEFLLFRID